MRARELKRHGSLACFALVIAPHAGARIETCRLGIHRLMVLSRPMRARELKLNPRTL